MRRKVICDVVALMFSVGIARAAAALDADKIINATGIQSGLVCLVGEAHLGLARNFARNGRFLVHWLVTGRQDIDVLRKQAQAANLGGLVIIEPAESTRRLPYPARFVSLLVADLDRLGDQPTVEVEVRRVLATRGAAYLKQGGRWGVLKTDRAAAPIDDWTHKWYDASGNPVSRDRLAGLPQLVQWQHGPAMHDGAVPGKMPRIADGRFFAIDNASGALVCRDAGNGLLLWRRELGLPATTDFVALDGRVYLHHDPDAAAGSSRRFAERGPLVGLDASDGKLLQVYRDGLRADDRKRRGRGRARPPVPWFIVTQSVIVQAYGPDLVVLDREKGTVRWRAALEGATWFSPVALGDLLVAAECAEPAYRQRLDGSANVRAVGAFSLADGTPRWRRDAVMTPRREAGRRGRPGEVRLSFKPLAAAEGRILMYASSYQTRAPGAFVAALDAASGRELWRREIPDRQWNNTVESSRVVLRDGQAIFLGSRGIQVWDAASGGPIGGFRRKPRRRRFLGRGDAACSGSRATVEWLLCNAHQYWNAKLECTLNYGARSACGTGVVPANGMLFVLPTGCDCTDHSRGYQGLACQAAGVQIDDQRRLETFARPPAGNAGPKNRQGAWPTFLADTQRSSAVAAALPTTLRQRWRVRVTQPPTDTHVDRDRRQSERYLGALSAPVVADGLVVVACPETHQVVALDAASGRRRWAFTAGGKVDSPPTLHRGLALFGAQDGRVYALRAEDGRPVWRFTAAPWHTKAVLHGHLASASPLHGSVLVLGEVAVVTAGLHSELGGLHAWVLAVATGKPRQQAVFTPDLPHVSPTTNEILVASVSGDEVWAGRSLRFGLDLKPKPIDRFRDGPPMRFDRNGALIRFPGEGRGGSTHGWKGAMGVFADRAQRAATDGRHGYLLKDPTARGRHPVRADKSIVLWCVTASRSGRRPKPLWEASVAALGNKESYSALIKAGGRLYLGGGKRDGSSGFVQVVNAADGKLIAEYAAPARVTECGLAAAGDALYVCCENGELLRFGR